MLTTFIAILLAAIVLGYGGWYLYVFIRYITSGEYDIDQRIRETTR